MKKFFAVAALVLGIFVAQVSQAEAKEYYCGNTSDGYRVYFISESATRVSAHKMTCNTRCVRNGDTIYVKWFFKAAGGWRYAFSDDAPDRDWKLTDSDNLANKVFACTTNMIYIGEVMPNSYIPE